MECVYLTSLQEATFSSYMLGIFGKPSFFLFCRIPLITSKSQLKKALIALDMVQPVVLDYMDGRAPSRTAALHVSNFTVCPFTLLQWV